jgi:hypothetical protein
MPAALPHAARHQNDVAALFEAALFEAALFEAALSEALSRRRYCRLRPAS